MKIESAYLSARLCSAAALLALLAACGGGGGGGASSTTPPATPWSGTKMLGVAGKNTEGNAVATDASGNVYVAGYTQGGLDGNTRTGATDFFVTKFDPSGNKLFTRQLGAASTFTRGNAVATDASGNVYVAGYTDRGLDGNTRTGSTDCFVTKFDPSGNKLFTRQLGVTGQLTGGRAVATDASGNVYVAGYTYGGLDGNTRTGNDDFFVTKFGPSGNKLFTRQLGATSAFTGGMAVATDASGHVYVAGQTDGGLDGNTRTGNGDFFVTKFDSSGNKFFTRQLGAASAYTTGNAVATDASGDAFVAGSTYGGLDGNTRTGNEDFFVTKYNSSGVKQ